MGRRHIGSAPSGLELAKRLRAACSSCVRFRPERGQRIEFAPNDPRTLWLVESGSLLLQRHLAPHERQVLLVLLPGDAFDPTWLPPMQGLDLVAAAPSVVMRAQLAVGKPSEDDRIQRVRGDLARHALACLAQHSMCLGRMTGEERVASFLVHLACRATGDAPASRVSLPLTRRELADCLALNVDTVSRILATLRRQRVLARASRNELVIADCPALTRISPLKWLLAPEPAQR